MFAYFRIREISPKEDQDDPKIALLFPNTEPTSHDLRCGRNASVVSSPVKTARVQAGDTIGFGVGVTELGVCTSISFAGLHASYLGSR